MTRSISPKGKNDVVMTPPKLARAIVDHFMPSGHLCDPCRGDGAFYNALIDWSRELPDWYEITAGKDYLQHGDLGGPVDWVITNFPWGDRFNNMICHAMKNSNNVVSLNPINAWMTKRRLDMLKEHGFGIVEILRVPTPTKEESPTWPQSGFALAATWLRRGWKGGITMSELDQ